MSKLRTKSEKEEYKKQMAKTQPVFKLQITGDDRVLCKYIFNVEKVEELRDDPIELPHKGGILNLTGQGKYDIIARACSCNIPAVYVLKNKKLPVFYMTVIYASQLVTGAMFNYFLYFTIDAETSKSLILPKHYLNKSMSGKFTLELLDAEGFLTYFIKHKKQEIEDQVLESFVDKFDALNNEPTEIVDKTKEDLLTDVTIEVEKRLDVYRNVFEPIPIEGYITRKKIFERMEQVFRSPIFEELSRSCLEFTQKKRIDDMGETTIKIPKKVLNLEECVNNPDKIDEYLAALSSDSDDSDDVDSDIGTDTD